MRGSRPVSLVVTQSVQGTNAVSAVLKTAAEPAPTLLNVLRAVLPEGVHYCVFLLPEARHVWVGTIEELAQQVEIYRDRPGVYYGTTAFSEKSRKQVNVPFMRSFYLDLDAGPEKFAKHGDAVYSTQKDALTALRGFIKATGLSPTYIVSSGAGLHVYYCLDQEIPRAQWQEIAKALQQKCVEHGLRVDPTVTQDAARILRPMGALHGNGNRVKVLVQGTTTTAADLIDKLEVVPAPARPPYDLRVNKDVCSTVEGPPSSAWKIIERCAAMKEFADCKGNTSEPLWWGALGVFNSTVEGLDIALELSSGHPDFDPAETEQKFNRRAGTGPTTCETFGGLTKACEGCEHRGKITSPAQLGRMTAQEVTALPEEKRPAAPPEFAELNARYAQVRVGTDVVIADTQTPTASVDGVHRGLGFLNAAAFRQTFAGQMIMVVDKLRPLAGEWLAWPQRRQYEGVVFAPGEEVPRTMLNLDQGFGVVPVAGDVTLWLRLLEALIPDERQRKRALKWFAWKIQNPGGVPGVILILSGGKGTGKNSLVDPIVRIFGAHGAVYDDSEQVAGRFTGHLMTIAFAVLDEALFTGDPRQMDRIKARVTATNATYEFKGRDPIRGVNHCAYVSLTNHTHVWQATVDERRAFVVTVADTLRGDRAFWGAYHQWLSDGGAGALLHYLQAVDLSGFDPRQIPQSDALARQVEMTMLRNPAAAWWHAVLCEGAISWRDEGGGMGRRVPLNDDEPTTLDKEALRLSFTGGDSRRRAEWAGAMRQLRTWVGASGLREVRERVGVARARVVELPSLSDMRAGFTAVTGVHDFDETH